MSSAVTIFRYLPLFALVAVAALALPSPAVAASDVRVNDPIDCVGHPRRIAIQNYGNSAQDLAGWKLLSNKSNEVFDLGVPGSSPTSIAPGDAFYVFNGHQAPPAPQQVGNQWIYPWNYTPVLDEAFFVLTPDGTDFIRLVDASASPWREVSHMLCPDNPGPIPPLQQPQTPTPQPSNPDPGTGGNTGGTDGNQAAEAQTDGSQSTGAAQTAASGNAATTGGTGTAAQPGNVSGQAAGGPASGIGLLSGSSRPPLAGYTLALGFVGIVAGAALAFIGAGMLRRALRGPT